MRTCVDDMKKPTPQHTQAHTHNPLRRHCLYLLRECILACLFRVRTCAPPPPCGPTFMCCAAGVRRILPSTTRSVGCLRYSYAPAELMPPATSSAFTLAILRRSFLPLEGEPPARPDDTHRGKGGDGAVKRPKGVQGYWDRRGVRRIGGQGQRGAGGV